MDSDRRVLCVGSTRRILLCALTLWLLPVVSLGGTAPASDSTAVELEQGKKIYDATCAECHGPSGRGDGPKARKLGFRPRDLSLGSFKCRCTPTGALPTDQDLYKVVSQGMPGTPMKAHEKTLSPEKIQAVVQYVKTLSTRFAAQAPQPCIRVPEPSSRSEALVAEGKQIYRIMQCWKCHGKSGRGDGPSAPDLKDDWGLPIKAYNFTVLKRFKCGLDDRDLYRTLHTGMNGSPMPSYDTSFLFAQENVADLSPFENFFGPAEAQELAAFMRRQPDGESLKAQSESARQELIEKRTWALIHYLRSLLAPSRK